MIEHLEHTCGAVTKGEKNVTRLKDSQSKNLGPGRPVPSEGSLWSSGSLRATLHRTVLWRWRSPVTLDSEERARENSADFAEAFRWRAVEDRSTEQPGRKKRGRPGLVRSTADWHTRGNTRSPKIDLSNRSFESRLGYSALTTQTRDTVCCVELTRLSACSLVYAGMQYFVRRIFF